MNKRKKEIKKWSDPGPFLLSKCSGSKKFAIPNLLDLLYTVPLDPTRLSSLHLGAGGVEGRGREGGRDRRTWQRRGRINLLHFDEGNLRLALYNNIRQNKESKRHEKY